MTEQSNVIQMPVPERKPEGSMVIGLIPCQNRFFLDLVWPIIQPGVAEIEQRVAEEWDQYKVWGQIYAGQMFLYMAYADEGAPVPPAKQQEVFVGKLKDPQKGFAAFVLAQLLDKSFHIFCGYVMPEYRTTNIMRLGFEYLEAEARKMHAPYLSTCEVDDRDVSMKALGFCKVYTAFRKKLS